MTMLPEKFIQWNYFPRVKSLKEMIQQGPMRDMSRFFLESTRHNPALCTAFEREDGSVSVNAKIVGIGYVVKDKYLNDATNALAEHIKYGDELFRDAKDQGQTNEAVREYQRRGVSLLLEHLCFEDPKKAEEHVDFNRMSTSELALSKPHSSKHTWQVVQHNLNACLLFYQPPSVSFEIRGRIEIHENDVYHEFVNLVHDSFHYEPPETRKERRPVYIFRVEEVYDNSTTPTGFGTRIA
jgi:hypothetical protein